jgi:ABC-2 type transport system permease protein
LQGRLYGLTDPEIERRLDDLRDLIDIGDALDRFVGSYSGGMRRRLDLASALVTDIQSGYFDRLLVSPVNRYSLLLGLMVADLALVVALCVPVLLLGFVLGVGFATGPMGVLAFLLLSGFWGLAFTGFPYAIALRTGNPAAVNSSFILFFPLAFLTTTFLPQEALTGWLATVADYNPVTYLLAGLRALISSGWVAADLLPAIGAVAAVSVVTFGLAFSALRARVRRA